MPLTREHRLRTIKLSAAERSSVRQGPPTVIHRPVGWSLTHRVPEFDRAYIDPGGTDIWGPGPYLKVPDRDPRDGEQYVDRVFCPWGYPPRQLRVMRSPTSVVILSVEVSYQASIGWEWLLTLAAASPPAAADRPPE